jgi:DNA-binding NarL/FixJ family response regulator
MTVRLLTVDPVTLTRLGYIAAVAGCPDITLIGQASTSTEAMELVATRTPDVVTIDMEAPGLDLARALRTAEPPLGIIMTGPEKDQLVFQSLEAGMSGYVPRTASVELLLSAVRHASVAPTSFTAPDLAAAISRRRLRSPLSPREQEIFEQLGTGASMATIADRLRLTESTVRTYLARLYEKLDVHSRADAIRVGAQRFQS